MSSSSNVSPTKYDPTSTESTKNKVPLTKTNTNLTLESSDESSSISFESTGTANRTVFGKAIGGLGGVFNAISSMPQPLKWVVGGLSALVAASILLISIIGVALAIAGNKKNVEILLLAGLILAFPVACALAAFR